MLAGVRASFAAVVIAFMALMAHVGVARADEPSAAAPDAVADAKRRGDEALVNGRPAEALAAYNEAYKARPDAALVYNIGRAQQALGDYPAALAQLEQFEATAPPDIRARVPGLQTLLADLRKRVSMLVIAADVDGATVRIDERVVGTTPLRMPLRLNAGVVTLIVDKDGFFPYQRALTLVGGAIATSDVKLASKQTKAIVTIRSPIAGAQVALDGKPEGTVPTEIVVTPGSHQVELTLDGYRPTQSALAVAAGERRTFDLTLEPSAPITKKWWFWTGLGLVAAGATITIIALTTERSADSGSVQPGRINTGLRF